MILEREEAKSKYRTALFLHIENLDVVNGKLDLISTTN